MTILRDGLPLVALALFATVVAYALALYRRSWSIWLVAFGLTVLSLAIAWLARGAEPIAAVVATVLDFAERSRP